MTPSVFDPLPLVAPSQRIAHVFLSACCLVATFTLACKSRPAWEKGKKVAHLALRSKPTSFDPTLTADSYSNEVQSQVYEGLYTYKYLVRPYQITPLLAKSMPTISEDGLTYTIEIRDDVFFHDDACFPGNKGRKMVAQDFVYSVLRNAEKTRWAIGSFKIVSLDSMPFTRACWHVLKTPLLTGMHL